MGETKLNCFAFYCGSLPNKEKKTGELSKVASSHRLNVDRKTDTLG